MTLDDLPAVQGIEKVAFDSSWPATAFEHELRHNGAARYLIAEQGGRALGYGGLWLQFDEAHVVTVAVLPEARRQGVGRLLVHALVGLAESMGMGDATLEVRESNSAARALYRTYGFYEVGRRVRYYEDNGEDALIMTTEALRSAAYRQRFARLEQELERRFGREAVERVAGAQLARAWAWPPAG